MTALDKTTEMEHVDAAFHYGGLLFRAVGYMLVYALADRFDFGRSMLTGVLLGDLIGQAAKVAWSWRYNVLGQLGELLLIGVVYLLVRSMMVWPEDPAMRAITGLSAFGLLVGHVGGSVLTRIGPSDV